MTSPQPSLRPFEGLRGRRNWLFDLDGTLVESEPYHESAYRNALQHLAPHALPHFHYPDHRGRSTDDVVRSLPIGDANLRRAVVELKRDLFAQAIKQKRSLLKPGALDLLRSLKRSGHHCYLVTGAATRSAELILEATEIRGTFDGVVSSEAGIENKPSPALYQSCLSRFSLDASASIAIEDSSVGVQAAVASGLEVIGIGRQKLPQTRWHFSNLPELSRILNAHGVTV